MLAQLWSALVHVGRRLAEFPTELANNGQPLAASTKRDHCWPSCGNQSNFGQLAMLGGDGDFSGRASIKCSVTLGWLSYNTRPTPERHASGAGTARSSDEASERRTSESSRFRAFEALGWAHAHISRRGRKWP